VNVWITADTVCAVLRTAHDAVRTFQCSARCIVFDTSPVPHAVSKMIHDGLVQESTRLCHSALYLASGVFRGLRWYDRPLV